MAELEGSKASAKPSDAEPKVEDVPDLTRVVVIGTSGSGKTTFARALASMLGVPHIELDSIHWLPDWTPRDHDELRALVKEAVSDEHWVLDGNYRGLRDLIWPRATAIIWLNYPFSLVFWRALRRTLKRIVQRQELFSGNRESFRQTFLSRNSPLWWVITTYPRRRRDYRALSDKGVFPHLSWIEFQSRDQAEAFLAWLGGAKYQDLSQVMPG